MRRRKREQGWNEKKKERAVVGGEERRERWLEEKKKERAVVELEEERERCGLN